MTQKQDFWRRELWSYAEGVHRLGSPASAQQIANTERRLGEPLERSVRALLEEYDGFSLFHDSIRVFSCAELDGRSLGEDSEGFLQLDGRGRVLRIEEGAGTQLVVGSSLWCWLNATFAREAIVYTREGEFRDVFEDRRGSATELRQEIMRKREEVTIRHDPDAPAAHFELGRLLANAGQPKSAFAAASRAVELEPSFAWAHFELGRILQKLARPDAAIASFGQAANLDPEQASFFLAWAARVAKEVNIKPVLSHLRARIRLIDPTFAERHRRLAATLRAAGDSGATDLESLVQAVE